MLCELGGLIGDNPRCGLVCEMCLDMFMRFFSRFVEEEDKSQKYFGEQIDDVEYVAGKFSSIEVAISTLHKKLIENSK